MEFWNCGTRREGTTDCRSSRSRTSARSMISPVTTLTAKGTSCIDSDRLVAVTTTSSIVSCASAGTLIAATTATLRDFDKNRIGVPHCLFVLFKTIKVSSIFQRCRKIAVITANLTENDRISVSYGGSAGFIGLPADRCLTERRRICLAECRPASAFPIRTVWCVWCGRVWCPWCSLPPDDALAAAASVPNAWDHCQ